MLTTAYDEILRFVFKWVRIRLCIVKGNGTTILLVDVRICMSADSLYHDPIQNQFFIQSIKKGVLEFYSSSPEHQTVHSSP